jgi:hypothetical protein
MLAYMKSSMEEFAKKNHIKFHYALSYSIHNFHTQFQAILQNKKL